MGLPPPCSHAEQKSGHIINMASVFGIKMFAPGGTVYCATKAAVRALTEGLRMELHSQNIRCTMISPGAIATELSESSSDEATRKNLREFMKMAIPASAIARAIAYAIEQPAEVEVDEMVIRQPYRISSAEVNATHRLRGGQGQDLMGNLMGKRLALPAIRLFVSVNLLYAAIFLKLAGVPGSVALFTQMSQAVHGLVSQQAFRLGSGALETAVAILLLIPKTARLAAGLTAVWMTAVILSHIFVLGYGWFFVDALLVMALAVIYLLLTRTHSHGGESVGTMAAIQTHQK